MVGRISLQGMLENGLQRILTLEKQRVDLSFSVSSGGKKSRRLQDYGVDAPILMNLRSVNRLATKELQALEISVDIVKQFDTSIDELVKLSTDIAKRANVNEVDDPAVNPQTQWPASIEQFTRLLAAQINSTLNGQIGDRYLFAGQNLRDPPANDLLSLRVYDAADIADPNSDVNLWQDGESDEERNVIPAFRHVGPPAVEDSYHGSYDFAGPPGQLNPKSWERQDVSISDGQRVKVGITATHPGVQRLIQSWLTLRSASEAGLDQTQRQDLVRQAFLMAGSARDLLRGAATEVAEVGGAVQRVVRLKESQKLAAQTAMDRILLRSEDRVAAEFDAVGTALQKGRLALQDLLRTATID